MRSLGTSRLKNPTLFTFGISNLQGFYLFYNIGSVFDHFIFLFIHHSLLHVTFPSLGCLVRCLGSPRLNPALWGLKLQGIYIVESVLDHLIFFIHPPLSKLSKFGLGTTRSKGLYCITCLGPRRMFRTKRVI